MLHVQSNIGGGAYAYAIMQLAYSTVPAKDLVLL